MCGRYTLRTPPSSFWPASQLDLFSPRFNVAPGTPIAVARILDQAPELSMLSWGLVPFWSKDAKIAYRTINARGETVHTKPAFKSAFQRRRCLVLADGYFEWHGQVKGKKQPYFIRMKDDRPFAFAGLWEKWRGPRDEPLATPLESCTIVTTESNELTAELHDRMPVVLPEEDYDLWLDPEFEGESKLRELLAPWPSDEMEFFPVSTLVNSADNDSAACVRRLPTLF